MTGDGHVPFRGSLGVKFPGATRLPRSPREDVQTLDGFLDRSSRQVSGAGRRTEAGCVEGAAFGVMAAPQPKDTAVFLHCDLLPVNMLWSRGRITGLTDWNSIHRGARAIDVGHCRRYLAALYSPEWSEQLRSLYESIAGVTLDPWWDLYALLHYDDSGPKWIRTAPRITAGSLLVALPVLACRTDPCTKAGRTRIQSPANNGLFTIEGVVAA